MNVARFCVAQLRPATHRAALALSNQALSANWFPFGQCHFFPSLPTPTHNVLTTLAVCQQPSHRQPLTVTNQVRKIYEKLQRNERNRVGAASAAAPGSPTSPSRRLYGPSVKEEPAPSSERRPPPSFVPVGANTSSDAKAAAGAGTNSIIASALNDQVQLDVGTGGDQEGIPRPAVATSTAEENGARGRVAETPAGSVGSRSEDGKNEGSGKGSDGGLKKSGKDSVVEKALKVGERLQEAVRLCSVGAGCGEGGGAPGALTLSEGVLSRPKHLLKSLALLCARSNSGGDTASEGEAGKRESGTGAGGAANPRGFLTQAFTEEDARRAADQPLGNPLMETAWLAARFPKVTLADLLANRLEISLWASYWKCSRRGAL